MTTDVSLLETARDWAAHDIDEATRAELTSVIEAAQGGDAEAAADLASRFAGPLTFGTAGLRGRIGAGQTRMNAAVVVRATAGLVRFLTDGVAPDPVVVIGFDARHGSRDFARAAAEVVSAAGGRALLMPERLPTPVLAYAVRSLGADAGVMVTASHNPPDDNGYKVYLGGRAATGDACGVQIVPPSDAAIAQRITDAPAADAVPRDGERVTVLGPEVLEGYLARAGSLAAAPADPLQRSLRIVLTPLHGVGGAVAVQALARAGFTDVHLVAAQAQPDPDFPTVSFPNPEEPGALDLALDDARRLLADLVIALDPDADRCCVAVPDPAVEGGWRQLTGDELGALLGEQAAARAEAEGRSGALACSIVSGRLLSRIATAHGLTAVTTLTGFKWIARTPGLIFGYEEAIGYCTDPQGVRDKDGITAAVRVAALADGVLRGGRTMLDALDDLASAHGLHATAPLSFRVEDLSLIADAMARLRAEPPTRLAGSEVVAAHDLSAGYAGLPPTDGMLLLTAEDDRVIVRPSGTEPKLKCYLEVVLPCADGQVPHEAARERLSALRVDVRAAVGL